jgi:hypothetical protein
MLATKSLAQPAHELQKSRRVNHTGTADNDPTIVHQVTARCCRTSLASTLPKRVVQHERKAHAGLAEL